MGRHEYTILTQSALDDDIIGRFMSARGRLQGILAAIPDALPKPTGYEFSCYRQNMAVPEGGRGTLTQDYLLALGYRGSETVRHIMHLRHAMGPERSRFHQYAAHAVHLTYQSDNRDYFVSPERPDDAFQALEDFLSVFYHGFCTLRPGGYQGCKSDLAAIARRNFGLSVEQVGERLIPPPRRSWLGALFPA